MRHLYSNKLRGLLLPMNYTMPILGRGSYTHGRNLLSKVAIKQQNTITLRAYHHNIINRWNYLFRMGQPFSTQANTKSFNRNAIILATFTGLIGIFSTKEARAEAAPEDEKPKKHTIFSNGSTKDKQDARKILIVNSSSKLEGSSSRELTQAFIKNWSLKFPSDIFVMRDIGLQPVPHLTEEALEGISSDEKITRGHKTRNLSDKLISEITQADVIVISLPMYNFSIPSSLKAYFDHVIRSGMTVDYTDDGTVGLLKDKQVVVITTGGGAHQDTVRDFQAPYVKFILNYMGLNDVTFIRAHKLLWSEKDRQESMTNAESQIKDYVAKFPILSQGSKSLTMRS